MKLSIEFLGIRRDVQELLTLQSCQSRIVYYLLICQNLLQTDRQTNYLTPYTGVCGFFLQVKFATSLITSLTGRLWVKPILMMKEDIAKTLIRNLTLTPQGSVASSRAFCMTWLMVSRSDKISAKFLVPKTLRRVVAASRRV